jgi:hypothetical protein
MMLPKDKAAPPRCCFDFEVLHISFQEGQGRGQGRRRGGRNLRAFAIPKSRLNVPGSRIGNKKQLRHARGTTEHPS